MKKYFYPLVDNPYRPKDVHQAIKVLRSSKITSGPKTIEFQNEFSKKLIQGIYPLEKVHSIKTCSKDQIGTPKSIDLAILSKVWFLNQKNFFFKSWGKKADL